MKELFLTMMIFGAIGSAAPATQEVAETEILAGSGSRAALPFWATANRYGLMPETCGGLVLLQAHNEFDPGKELQWRIGTSLAASIGTGGVSDEPAGADTDRFGQQRLMIDELYGSLRWKVLTLDLGMKHRELDYFGADPRLGSLSVTGGHIVESGNARTMPGYNITHSPVALPWTGGRLRVRGEWGDYRTIDLRYVQDALVHRTKLGMDWDIVPRLTFSFTLDHYALWGGHHPNGGDIAVNLGNYLRVVTGRGAGADGVEPDRFNVIGDQGGAETFSLAWRGDGWQAGLRHDIPYADGSGMGFQNWPDGVNTLHFSFDDKDRWVSDVVYEYHYTMYQSGTVNGEVFDADGNSLTPPGVQTTGIDNYFNNYFYCSGWTHFGRPVGSPLLFPAGTRDGSWWTDGMTGGAAAEHRMTHGTLHGEAGIENNRYIAHHIGLGGKLWRRHPYRLMLTYSENFGTYREPYIGPSQINQPWGTVHETGLRQFSAGLNGSIEGLFGRSNCDNWASRLSITYGLYIDRGQLLPDNFGLTIGLRYTL